MSLTIVIADDEAPAREELAYLLKQMDDVGEVIEAVNGADAIAKTKAHQPDILFMDIQMPELNGLNAAALLSELGISTKVVFCTAYDQYAVDAFKVRAFHYLLKPYDEEDVRKILEEFCKERNGAEKKAVERPDGNSLKLALEGDDCIVYTAPKEIVFLSKTGKNVSVHLHDRVYETHCTLYELEEKLKGFSFFRCHKSYLVNLEFISKMRSLTNGTFDLFMMDAAQSVVPVSRNYIRELRSKLEL